MRSTPESDTRQLLWQMLVLAISYAALGRLSLLLAIPPGYSIAIYPSAGVALGMVLTGGYRLMPGVAVGAFVANLLINLNIFGSINTNALIASTIVAAGASLQTLVGCKLILKKLHDNLALDSDKAIFQFFIYGGVVACLINASISVTALVALGIIPWQDFFNNWIGWWVGDTFGVLTITPIIMVIYGKPREIWYARRWSVLVPLLICLMLVITAFAFTRYREEQKQQLEFRLKAERIGQNLQNKLDTHADIMRNIERLYASSLQVSRSDFATFVSHTLQSQKAISFLSWVPKVDLEQRQSFEVTVLREGFANYQLQEMNEFNQLVEVSVRDEYYPIRYIEPFFENHQMFGYDMGSTTARRIAIEDARDSGHLTVTDPLISNETDGREQLHVLLFAPVYENGKPQETMEQRKAAFSGTAVSMIRMADLVREILSNEDMRSVRIKFYDLSYPGKKGLFIDEISGLTPTYLFQSTINFGGRQFALLAQPSSEYWRTHVAWITWITMIGGLLFTGLLGAYLLVATAHTFGIENLVAQRTAELHDSEERLRTILDNAAEGILTTNEHGIIESANRSAEVLLKYTHGSLRGRNMFSLFPDPESLQFLTTHLHTTNRERQFEVAGKSERKELLAKQKDGHDVPVELAITRVRLGMQVLYVIIVHDLSEKKRVEKLKNEFVSAVSHELRTPLTSIRGVLGLLAGGVAGDIPEKAQSMLVMANDNAKRLTALINDLLDFEKLEYGSMQFHFETLSLAELIDSSLQSNLGYAQSFEIGIQYDSTVDPATQVRVDSQRFVQVLSNLLSNAIKFSQPHGQIDVRVTLNHNQNQVRIEVQDYGIGISEEFKSSIFQKFTQEDAKAARKYAGTGLGLSLTKTMIEKMGGQIGFTSTENLGSCFYITLPLVTAATAAETPSATEA
ncbi:CHASE domain-containing protein [Undibacterium sp. Ji42W]|uniref:CHASE domain-containing protein n=1 Tax=Undibacterium sp. Ji42W TaxID=3413039 RepID=UPI003BF29BFA